MYQGIPQLLLLLFLIMLMCNLMSPVKFAFLALFPSLPFLGKYLFHTSLVDAWKWVVAWLPW